MKKKNVIQICLFFVICFVLILANSCGKDEESSKNDPVITWANPADITYGTLLSTTQLNAAADVSGSFIYTPAIGTKLDEGASQDLKVDFKPTDAAAYNFASKTVKINVIASTGTVTDIDGNVYKTIIIGTQTWMAENLRTTKYNDGNTIPNVTDNTTWSNLTTPAYCWYDNNISNQATYGALYNWYTVNTGKLAPMGWHVPTDAEWTKLENYLIANGFNYDGTTTGNRDSNNKIGKALASDSIWHSCNLPGTVGSTDYPEKYNTTGFSALPGGHRTNYGIFEEYDIEYEAYWWTATAIGPASAWMRKMGCEYSSVGRSNFGNMLGMSIRCVRN